MSETQPGADALLSVRNLCRHYEERPILRELSFEVAAGERIAIMGPSGSGKSTLLNCLGGIDRPDKGQILLQGEDMARMSAEALGEVRRRRIGQIFQFFHLLPTLTAFENVELPLILAGQSLKDRQERVSGLLDQTGVAHRAGALPSEMSGGEMQRVAIARALAASPRLVLADEPTGNLDTATGDRILDLLQATLDREAVALILVTHNTEATRICTRTLHLLDGVLQTQAAAH